MTLGELCIRILDRVVSFLASWGLENYHTKNRVLSSREREVPNVYTDRMLICSLTIALLVSVVSAETTTAKPDWENLKSTLGDAFQLSQVDDWIDQCVIPFADVDVPVSNYQLFEQTSGLCMNQVSCAYEYCYGESD